MKPARLLLASIVLALTFTGNVPAFDIDDSHKIVVPKAPAKPRSKFF